MTARALAAALVFGFAVDASANRPTQALEADRQAAEAEVRDLERRAHALDEQAALRQDRLRQRIRALYKLSSGGYLRLLAGAESAAELGTRHQAIGRVLSRDLEELLAVREEAAALDADQARRVDQLARAVALGHELRLASEEPPTGLEARAGKLSRPVPGPIVGAFGAFRDPELGLERSRRGVELRTHAGQTVRAIAAGQVRWVGDVPGLGRGLAIDHGDGYLTITARLASTRLTPGELLAEGAPVGEAAGPTLYMELAQDGTPIDPAPWLSR
ncbi:MAG TPA: peptidoglycan DD-metalloendopeptidase family protein [Polyangia bacterium]|nr:peptidoglycan DD-metalloendopeptidase family protein [Polyangia bacterium]